MSAEKCNICGVYGTSTYKCCGNNKVVRFKQINNEIQIIENTIEQLQNRKKNLIMELQTLENES